VTVDEAQAMMEEVEAVAYIETSAKTGEGLATVKSKLSEAAAIALRALPAEHTGPMPEERSGASRSCC
jgi:hypothetical protein